jgi:hypothetical protein
MMSADAAMQTGISVFFLKCHGVSIEVLQSLMPKSIAWPKQQLQRHTKVSGHKKKMREEEIITREEIVKYPSAN